MVITREKWGVGDVEEDIGALNGDGKRLNFGSEHTTQYVDDVL